MKRVAFGFAAFHFAVYLSCLCWGSWAKENLPALQWEKQVLPMFFIGLVSGILGLSELWLARTK